MKKIKKMKTDWVSIHKHLLRILYSGIVAEYSVRYPFQIQLDPPMSVTINTLMHIVVK